SYRTRVHPKTGQTKFHAGFNLGTPVGTTLKASSSGVVLTASTMNGYGKPIMISHSINGKTYTTLYTHLNDINVSSGQAVSQGDVIGATGKTGMSTAPHLHFEIHEGPWNAAKSNSVNPMSYL